MLGRLLGGILADPVIVMARSESFGDVVEEVRRDAVDFPLEVDGVKELVILPSVSMVAATLPRLVVEDLRARNVWGGYGRSRPRGVEDCSTWNNDGVAHGGDSRAARG